MVNDEIRNVTKIEAQLSCSGDLAFKARNRCALGFEMMDEEVLSAQECLEINKSRSAIVGSLKKTEQKATLQLRFDGPKSFQRLAK